MRLLLDTHAFLWWLGKPSLLSAPAREAISDPDHQVWVSAASIWEISIKAKLGRLDLGGADPMHELMAGGFSELAISSGHAFRAGQLPRHHEDPFDRMLIAQCEIEGLTCVTRDAVFGAYGIKTLW